MTISNGLSRHIGNIWSMMSHTACEDGIIDACTKSFYLKDLSKEVMEEMETDHLHVLIREAFVRGNYLIVTNKAGREIRVPFDQVPALSHIRFRDRLNFEIQFNGSCLHWESADIHLDFESLLYYVDDEFRDKVDQESADRFKAYGKAIAKVRTAHKIPVDGITGIKAEDVQDVESGELRPEVEALSRYADALGLELNEFLNEVVVK